jgi:hypothetical protein
VVTGKCTDYTGAEKLHAQTRKVIGTKTKIYCQGTIQERRVLAALQTIKLGLTKVGNQAKPLKYSEKKSVIRTSVEQMFKRMTINLSVKLTTQHRLMCVLKNARLLPEGCCFLRDKGNEILFRINISLPLNNDCWIGRGWPMSWPPRSPDLTSMDFLWTLKP